MIVKDILNSIKFEIRISKLETIFKMQNSNILIKTNSNEGKLFNHVEFFYFEHLSIWNLDLFRI